MGTDALIYKIFFTINNYELIMWIINSNSIEIQDKYCTNQALLHIHYSRKFILCTVYFYSLIINGDMTSERAVCSLPNAFGTGKTAQKLPTCFSLASHLLPTCFP